jgi:isopenicillin-N epimerase
MPSPLAELWTLSPDVIFLNHGSFGACPRVVMDAQDEIRTRMERQPVRFMQRDLPGLIDAAREDLASFLSADPANLAFIGNATSGVNAVARSLDLRPGDEILTTSHDYNACRNVLTEAARRAGARIVVAQVPFPLADEQQIVDAILPAVTARTRLAMIDHITSPTALVFPIAKIVRALAERGVETLVDGAHAPGAVAMEIERVRPAYYTGNLHKWVCAPKGAAFLWARPDTQDTLHPAVISHGENVRRPGRSAFHDRFDWPGTFDPSAWLAVPTAIRFGAALWPGGWDELRERNRAAAASARAVIAGSLGVALPCPDSLLASMAAIPLPDHFGKIPRGGEIIDALQTRLLEEKNIEVPIVNWGNPTRRHVRISAHAHNSESDYRALAAALSDIHAGR